MRTDTTPKRFFTIQMSLYMVSFAFSLLPFFVPLDGIEEFRDNTERTYVATLKQDDIYSMFSSNVSNFMSPLILVIYLFYVLITSFHVVIFCLSRKVKVQATFAIVCVMLFALQIFVMIFQSASAVTYLRYSSHRKLLLNGYYAIPISPWFWIYCLGILFLIFGIVISKRKQKSTQLSRI